MKEAGLSDSSDAAFSFLIERVRNNLHIILCMSPVGDPFRSVIRAINSRGRGEGEGSPVGDPFMLIQ